MIQPDASRGSGRLGDWDGGTLDVSSDPTRSCRTNNGSGLRCIPAPHRLTSHVSTSSSTTAWFLGTSPSISGSWGCVWPGTGGICQLDRTRCSRPSSVVPSRFNRCLGSRTEREHHYHTSPRIREPAQRTTNNDTSAARRYGPLANPSIRCSLPPPEQNDGDDHVLHPLTDKNLPVFPHLNPRPSITDEEREVKHVLDCLAK